MTKVDWYCKPFHQLSVKEFHNLLELRINVFVVEQNCPYSEIDGKDEFSFHIWGVQANKVIAVARILPPGVSYSEWSIGRVASSLEVRNNAVGKELMKQAITQIYAQAKQAVPIRISAQLYLKKFYESFEFIQQGDTYLEDDIPHIEMLRKANEPA